MSTPHSRRVLAIALVSITSFLAGPTAASAAEPPTSVSLVADKSVVTVPDGIQLTATVDRRIYGTGYSYKIVDEDGIVAWNWCGTSVDTCVKTAGNPWAVNDNPPQRHFHAELHNANGLVARSDTITVEVRRFVWDVQLAANPPTGVVGTQGVSYTATLDRSVSGTGYQLYVIDDDTGNSTVCSSGTQCSKTIGRAWATNANPLPAHAHAEVRRTGDVAGTSAQLEAPFRRALFDVDLTFEEVPQTDGTTRWRATATSDRSVYGTSYQLKLRRSNGSIVCYASTGTTCAQYVAQGDTYRATVEDSSGRVFGDSGAWTLLAEGARNEVVDDVDLAYLASQFSSSTAICNALAEYPGSHVMEPPSTLSDQYRACVAAANTSSRIDTLRKITEALGGAAVSLGALWYLQREVVRPSPAPGTPWTSDDVKAPRPVPLPLLPQVDKLADALVQKNPTLSQRIVDEIAWQCQWSTAAVGLNARRECLGQPIFVSGDDVPSATNHDIEALAYWPAWVGLNYRPSAETPGSRTWYRQEPECMSVPAGEGCDEYPFWATTQGGPYAVKRPHLKSIDGQDNTDQGGLYGNFVTVCRLATGAPFLGIPLAPELEIPTQTRICNSP